MKPLTIIVMVLSAVTVINFGYQPADLDRISWRPRRPAFARTRAIVRHVLDLRAGISNSRTRFRHRVRDRCWPWRLGVGADLPATCSISATVLPTVATIMSAPPCFAAGVLSLLKLKPDTTETDLARNMTTTMGGASTPA